MAKRNMALASAAVATVLGGSLMFLRMHSDDLSRDVPVIWTLLKAKRETANYATRPQFSVADYFAEAVKKWPQKTFLNFINDDGTTVSYTFKQVDEWSNQFANAFVGKLKKGDVVALMMDNKPEFIVCLLGFAKLGVVSALINTNLTGGPLIHSFVTSNASSFIIGAEHVDAVKLIRATVATSTDAKEDKIKNGNFFIYGASQQEKEFSLLNDIVPKQSTKLSQPLPQDRQPGDTFVYIYTSGTTGLPKASIIPARRFMAAGIGWTIIFGLSYNDVYYSALPLYHSSASLIVLSSCIKAGMTMVFRKKFSQRKFWSDCKATNATVVQYIGEICAYLLNAPPSEQDKDHKVRIAVGNGMRGSIWEQFRQRFNVARIGEFYAATEGNATLLNMLNKPGAVGFVPAIANRSYPIYIVKFDIESEQFMRDKNGLCIVCAPGETGQLVSEISEGDPTREFKGYTSKEATAKKVVTDVMKKGDKFFATGDLLYRDEQGFFFFADRIGDTFRWKGENVATGEVEAVLRTFPGVLDITVYGVPIPNTSGNAGMANIVVSDPNQFNPKQFWDFAKEKLPSYSRPIFVRLGKEIQITGTFKHQKAALRKEGYNPELVTDPLFFCDNDKNTYVPITKDLHNRISSGALGAKL